MSFPGYVRNRVGIPSASSESEYVDEWGDCVPNNGVGAGVDYYTKHYTGDVELDYDSMNPTPQALAARDALLAYRLDLLADYADPTTGSTTIDLEIGGDSYNAILVWDDFSGPNGAWVPGEPSEVLGLASIEDIGDVATMSKSPYGVFVWNHNSSEWRCIKNWWVPPEQIDVSTSNTGEQNRIGFGINRSDYDTGKPVILPPGEYHLNAETYWGSPSHSCHIRGSGSGGSTILYSGSTPPDDNALFDMFGEKNVSFKDLNFDVSGTPDAKPFIRFVHDGLTNYRSKVVIEDCKFSNCQSSNGAVYIDFPAIGSLADIELVIKNCTFAGNAKALKLILPAPAYYTRCLVVVENCVFYQNTVNLDLDSGSRNTHVFSISKCEFYNGQFIIAEDSKGVTYSENRFHSGAGFTLGENSRTYFSDNKFLNNPLTSGVLSAAMSAGHADRIVWGTNYEEGKGLIPKIIKTDLGYGTYIAEEGGNIEILEINADEGNVFFLDIMNLPGKPGGVSHLNLKINGGYEGQEIMLVNTSPQNWLNASTLYSFGVRSYNNESYAMVVRAAGYIKLMRTRSSSQDSYFPSMGSSAGMWSISGYAEHSGSGPVLMVG